MSEFPDTIRDAHPGTVIMVSPWTPLMDRDDVQVYRKLTSGRWAVRRYPFDTDSGVTIATPDLLELCRGVNIVSSVTREHARILPSIVRDLVDAAFDKYPEPGASA